MLRPRGRGSGISGGLARAPVRSARDLRHAVQPSRANGPTPGVPGAPRAGGAPQVRSLAPPARGCRGEQCRTDAEGGGHGAGHAGTRVAFPIPPQGSGADGGPGAAGRAEYPLRGSRGAVCRHVRALPGPLHAAGRGRAGSPGGTERRLRACRW